MAFYVCELVMWYWDISGIKKFAIIGIKIWDVIQAIEDNIDSRCLKSLIKFSAEIAAKTAWHRICSMMRQTDMKPAFYSFWWIYSIIICDQLRFIYLTSHQVSLL